MTSQTAKTNLRVREQMVVETCVPAHMMFLMVEECAKRGFDLRADVMHRLNMAAASPLSGLDELSISRLAKRIDEVATALLRSLNPDDYRDGLYTAAMFVLTLVDQGLHPDPKNTDVLSSLLILDDVKDDTPDVDGQTAVWRLQWDRWQNKARDMLRQANLLGLYLKAPVAPAA